MTEIIAGLNQGETLVAIVVVVWIGIVLWAAVRPEADVARYAAIGATILAIAIVLGQSRPAEPETSVPEPVSVTASCTLVHLDMTADEVLEALGKPERIVSDEDIRGPAAEHWVYPSNRCRVHFMEGIVRAVE